MQGLGFPQLSNMRTLPVFFNMMTQGLIDAPTFSIYLNPDPAAEPAGEVQFGGMNTARYIGDIVWTPVVEKSCVSPSLTCSGGLLYTCAPQPFSLCVDACRVIFHSRQDSTEASNVWTAE